MIGHFIARIYGQRHKVGAHCHDWRHATVINMIKSDAKLLKMRQRRARRYIDELRRCDWRCQANAKQLKPWQRQHLFQYLNLDSRKVDIQVLQRFVASYSGKILNYSAPWSFIHHPIDCVDEYRIVPTLDLDCELFYFSGIGNRSGKISRCQSDGAGKGESLLPAVQILLQLCKSYSFDLLDSWFIDNCVLGKARILPNCYLERDSEVAILAELVEIFWQHWHSSDQIKLGQVLENLEQNFLRKISQIEIWFEVFWLFSSFHCFFGRFQVSGKVFSCKLTSFLVKKSVGCEMVRFLNTIWIPGSPTIWIKNKWTPSCFLMYWSV